MSLGLLWQAPALIRRVFGDERGRINYYAGKKIMSQMNLRMNKKIQIFFLVTVM
jgi:hypothetical protein